MTSINVYIADDHPVVRKGMVRLLKTFERVGQVKEAADGKELLALLTNDRPHIIILDIEMPVMGGVDTVKAVLQRFPNVKILILTMHSEEVLVRRLLDMGINGFLTKSSGPEEIEKAIYAIMDNDFYKNAITENAQGIAGAEENEGRRKLTIREIEILLLICKEMTSREISERLHISEKTFFNHRTNIMEKTGSKSNIGLLKYALRKGIIST